MTAALARQTKDDALDFDFDELYDAEQEQAALLIVFERRYRNMLRAVHEVVKDALAPDGFRLDDEATRRVLETAAEQVVRIDETTRTALREMLREGQRLGLSSWEIANGSPRLGFRGIEGLFSETWRGRAETIARTEMATAALVSAQDRYRATGLVDRQQIIDGDYDEACAVRNGRVVPITEQVGLLHPNCTVVTTPLLREGVAP